LKSDHHCRATESAAPRAYVSGGFLFSYGTYTPEFGFAKVEMIFSVVVSVQKKIGIRNDINGNGTSLIGVGWNLPLSSPDAKTKKLNKIDIWNKKKWKCNVVLLSVLSWGALLFCCSLLYICVC
jgi:hypothetical protein